MADLPLIQVQDSLYALLAADEWLRSKGWGVKDFVAEKDKPPYLVIGSDDGQDISAKLLPGMAIELELDFWSGSRGFKELKEAMTRVYDKVHMRKVLVVGDGAATTHVTYVNTRRDDDGIRRHGIMRITALTYGIERVGADRVSPPQPMPPTLQRLVYKMTDENPLSTDASLATVYDVTLGGNRSMAAPINARDGLRIIYRITQDATGGRTITWDPVFRFSEDVPEVELTTTPNATDYVMFTYNEASGTWDCTAVNQEF